MKRLWMILLLVTPACASTTIRTDSAAETRLIVDTGVHGLVDGSYFYVKTGLTGSASAHPGNEQAVSQLGANAMNQLVANAQLKPNQALVNLAVESGTAFLGGDRLRLVTVRGDIIEFYSNTTNAPPPSAPEPAAPVEQPAPAARKVGKGGK